MTQLKINVGHQPGDMQGDKLRDAMIKINDNFSDLYSITEYLTGYTMTNGSSGTSGSSGISSSSGSSGMTGSSGINGSSGTSGTNGISGSSGSSGENGSSGSSGVNGTSGTSGTNGISGSSGSNGSSGINGTNGISGSSGSSGENGSSGSSGSSGLNGHSGTNGNSGSSGSSGSSGLNGHSGTNGNSGTSGSSGSSGLNGTSGINGSSGTSGQDTNLPKGISQNQILVWNNNTWELSNNLIIPNSFTFDTKTGKLEYHSAEDGHWFVSIFGDNISGLTNVNDYDTLIFKDGYWTNININQLISQFQTKNTLKNISSWKSTDDWWKEKNDTVKQKIEIPIIESIIRLITR